MNTNRRTIDAVHCLTCGYDLTGLPTVICPECGNTMTGMFSAWPRPKRPRQPRRPSSPTYNFFQFAMAFGLVVNVCINSFLVGSQTIRTSAFSFFILMGSLFPILLLVFTDIFRERFIALAPWAQRWAAAGLILASIGVEIAVVLMLVR